MVTATKSQSLEEQLAEANARLASQDAELAKAKEIADESSERDVMLGSIGSVNIENAEVHSSKTGNQWIVIRLPMVVGRTTNDGKKWSLATTRGAKKFDAVLNGQRITLGVGVNCTLEKD